MNKAEQLNPAWWPQFWRSPAMLGLCAMLVVAFWWTFHWMGLRWDEVNSYYSHGWLIPPIVAVLLYRKRKQIAAAQVRPCKWGLAILLPCLFVHALGTVWQVGFVSGFCFIGVMIGLVLTLFGAAVLRPMLFPLLFLVFMVPLPVLLVESVSFRLKLLVAQFAVGILGVVGLPAVRQGSYIHIPAGTMVVDDVCSGLKYLISLTAFGALYAYVSPVSNRRKAVLFLLSVPISFVANVIRVTLMVVLGSFLGVATAEKWYFHDTLGFLLFAAAFVMLFVTEALFLKRPRFWAGKESGQAEAPAAVQPGAEPETTDAAPRPRVNLFAVTFVALAFVAAFSVYFAWPRATVPASDILAKIPMALGTWQGTTIALDDHTYDILGTRDVLSRDYNDGSLDGQRVGLLVVLAQMTRKRTHPPEQCYTGGGYEMHGSSVKSLSVSTPGGAVPLDVRELIFQRGDETELVWYFYKSGDSLTTSYWRHQAGLALGRLARPDAADILIRLDAPAPKGDLDTARHTLSDFLSRALPVLLERLP